MLKTKITALALSLMMVAPAFAHNHETSTKPQSSVDGTAFGNPFANQNTIGNTATPANSNPFSSNSAVAINTSQTANNQATAKQEQQTSVEEAAHSCATEEGGLGQAIAQTQAERIQEIINQPTISDLYNQAKKSENALTVGCFTASTKIINLSKLVPSVKDGLGGFLSKMVQEQIDKALERTQEALTKQVCDIGNDMIERAMRPINEELAKVEGKIMGLSLESMVGDKIATKVGGQDVFSQIVRDSLSEVVSQTDTKLKEKRDAYAQEIGFNGLASYDPLASLKQTVNGAMIDADKRLDERRDAISAQIGEKLNVPAAPTTNTPASSSLTTSPSSPNTTEAKDAQTAPTTQSSQGSPNTAPSGKGMITGNPFAQ